MGYVKDTWKALPTWSKGIIGLGVATLVTVEGVKIYKKLTAPPPAKLPQGGAGLPVVSYTNTGAAVLWNPAPLAQQLNDVMSGLFTLTGTKDDAWLQVAEIPTNDMLTSLYNYFNSKFGNGKTLTQWINDEYYYDILSGVKQKALQRLADAQLP